MVWKLSTFAAAAALAVTVRAYRKEIRLSELRKTVALRGIAMDLMREFGPKAAPSTE